MIVNADLDPDRRLALAYVAAAARPAVEALWRLDVTLGAILATGREPMIGRIRLAWWREALEALDRGRPPPEPLLEVLAERVVPGGVGGAELAAMEEGWSLLLADGTLGPEELGAYAAARGGLLFRYSARLLGLAGHPVEQAGALWALADLARRSASDAEARAALDAAARIAAPASWPPPLRPLGMLAALASRDVARGPGAREAQGAPARMLRMLRHRLTGG